MRNLYDLDLFRIRDSFVLESYGSYGDDGNGAFIIPVPGQMTALKVIASNRDGWDHISVSVNGQARTPTWAEMEHAKKVFLGDVTAMQLHLTAKDHISCHPYTLHVWRPHDRDIPLPPKIMV